jgi:hypothetical protein
MAPGDMPDRQQAALDAETLAGLPDQSPCDIPAGRVRAYVDAYLKQPSLRESSDSVWGLSERTPGSSILDPPPSAVVGSPLSFAEMQSRVFGTFGANPRVDSWRLSWGTLCYLVVGVTLLAGISLVSTDMLTKIGAGLVLALLGGWAFTRKVSADLRKRGGGDDLVGPLAKYNDSWGGIAAIFGGLILSVGVVFVALYFAPRLFGLQMNSFLAVLIAIYAVLLLFAEWGAIDPS